LAQDKKIVVRMEHGIGAFVVHPGVPNYWPSFLFNFGVQNTRWAHSLWKTRRTRRRLLAFRKCSTSAEYRAVEQESEKKQKS
jgi:hypothetical protein